MTATTASTTAATPGAVLAVAAPRGGFARLPCYSAIGLVLSFGADHTRLGPADTGFAVHTCGPAVAVVAAWLVAITSDQLLADHSVAVLVSGRLGQLAIGDQPGLRLSGQVPTNPSRRADLDLRVCRASVSTVEMTRSGATRRAMRQRPSVPSEPSPVPHLAGDQRQQTQGIRRGVFARGAIRPGEFGQHRQRVVDQSDTSACLACGSSLSMPGLPGLE